jgi:hypothetical protein
MRCCAPLDARIEAKRVSVDEIGTTLSALDEWAEVRVANRGAWGVGRCQRIRGSTLFNLLHVACNRLHVACNRLHVACNLLHVACYVRHVEHITCAAEVCRSLASWHSHCRLPHSS